MLSVKKLYTNLAILAVTIPFLCFAFWPEIKIAYAIYHAEQLIEEKKYDEALTLIDDIIKQKAITDGVYDLRGRAHDGQKNYKAAIDDYTKSIEINPKYVRGYGFRAGDYIRLGQYQKAIDDCTKAIALDPKSPYVGNYGMRALAYNELHQYDKAIADYTQAIEIEPKVSIFYGRRGMDYQKLKQYQKAIDDYTKVIELNPNALNYFVRSLAYSKLGNESLAAIDKSAAEKLGFSKKSEETIQELLE